MADSTPSQYTIMTNAALALIKQLVDSKNRIKSFRAVASDTNHFTDDQEAIAEMTAIGSVKQDGVIQDIQDDGDAKSYIQIDFDQSKIDTAYQLQTVGLFATDENGVEILYAVEALEHPQYMDVSTTMDMNSHFIHIVVGNTQQLDVSLTPAGTVSVAQMKSTLADYPKKDEVQNLIPDDIATTENVSDGDATTLKSAKAYADTQASDKISKDDRYGAENLVRNSAYMQNSDGWTVGGAGAADSTKFSIFVTPHNFYHSDKDNLIQIANLNTFTNGSASEVFLLSNSFPVTAGKTMAYSFLGFASANVVYADVYFIGYKADGTQVPMFLQQSINLSYSNLDGRSGTFTVPDDIITGQIRFDNNGSTNGKSAGLFITEVKVAEESVVSPWSPSRLDSVKDNGDDTVTINGKSYVPANDAYTVNRNDAGNIVGTVPVMDGDLTSADGNGKYYPIVWFDTEEEAKAASIANPNIDARA